MQYECLEELMMELSLYPNKAHQIISNSCKHMIPYNGLWFTVFKDGNCAAFTDDGELADISSITQLNISMIPNGISKINVPSSVTRIGSATFLDVRKTLSEVTLPDDLKTIDDNAFDGCELIQNIHIPETVTDLGAKAFSGCTSLKSINIPIGIDCIYYETFCRCTDLVSVEGLERSNVYVIQHKAFENCISLQDIELPQAIKFIHAYAFQNCHNLTELHISATINSIGFHAFYESGIKKLVFHGHDEYYVKNMRYYPWGIEDTSCIIYE